MKKSLIFLMAVSCILIGYSNGIAYAEDVEIGSDLSPKNITEAIKPELKVVKETPTIQVIFNGEKYGIIDKTTGQYYIKPVVDKITELSENEYKIVVQNLVGYINTETKINFLTKYDDITLQDKYLKIRKDNKYGLIDKEGNLLLQPEFQKVAIIDNNGEEYLYAKISGEYRVFQTTGKLVPENELYSVDKPVTTTIKKKNSSGANILVQDLKPEILKYRVNKMVVYEKIQEARKAVANANTVEDAKDKLAYEVVEVPDNLAVKKLKIEKNITQQELPQDETTLNKTKKSAEEDNIVKINHRKYVLVNQDNKVGLQTKKGKEILPVKFDTFNVKQLCEHKSKKIIIAKAGKAYSIYDTSGKLLAETVPYKINLYSNNTSYTYSYYDGVWTLRHKNKTLGTLVKEGEQYKFAKSKFYIRSLHEVNELLITLLTIA